MEQCLADVAIQQGDAADARRTQKKCQIQQGLLPAKTPNLIQIQLMEIEVHHTGAFKQHQLEQGMVYHVQQGAPGSQGVFLSQQAHHADAYQDEADLAHGGAGQGALEIDAEQRQHRTQHHGDGAQGEDQGAPGGVVPENVAGNGQNAPDAGLGQHTGQQRRSGSRCHGMGLGQPDVQGEHARLGTEAEEDAAPRDIQSALVGAGLGQGVQLGQLRGAQLLLQKKQSHECHKTADHCHRQIGHCRSDGLLRLLLDDPGEGGEGHDLKEHEGGVQISRQEYPQGCSQGQ